jgi:hypothetical protein
MSATALVPAPRLRNDLAAGWRHLVTGLRMTARDPLALGVLAFAGVLTAFLWGGPVGLVLGIDSLFALQYPWRGWVAALTEPPPRVLRLSTLLGLVPILFSQLVGAAIVAGALGRSTAPRRWPAGPAPGMPAVPIGPRTRVIADVLVAGAYVLTARALVLCVAGVASGQALFRRHTATYPEVAQLATLFPSLASPTTAYVSWAVVNTILGALFSFPLVLAWATTTRLDARGLGKLAAAALVVFGTARIGAMAHLASAVLVCLIVSAFLLVRLDDGSRAEPAAKPRPLRSRSSPGPLAQLHRDAWLGPARRLWWALLLAGALPLMLTLVTWPKSGEGVPYERVRLMVLATWVAFLQWPTLLLLTLFPFGLALVSPATSASRLFSGVFLRSWSALPVARESVIRAVYAHGLLAAGLAWLILYLQVRLRRAPLGPVLYDLPVVFLMAGIAVCEAVGDRRRGLIAVGALVAFLFGLPFAFALLPGTLGLYEPFSNEGMRLGIAGYAIGLAGALPPLVHLRGRSPAGSLQG